MPKAKQTPKNKAFADDASGEYLLGGRMLTDTRLAYGLGPLIQTLEEHQIPVDPILKAAEIPRFALEEPSFRIKLEQEQKFSEIAFKKLNRPDAGLLIGRQYHITMFGVLSLAAACCPTNLEAVRMFVLYPLLAWGTFQMSAWQFADRCTQRFDEIVDLGPANRFFVERDMACAVTASQDSFNQSNSLLAVTFRHDAPRDVAPYEEFFGCDVTFGAERNELVFEPDYWSRPLRQANEMTRRFYENQCRRISQALAAPLDYTEMLRSRLAAATPIPSLSELASELHLTERTIQRRLAAEGTSFSEILRDVRINRAQEYLGFSRLHMDEIAERLGFRDAVAFSHAFKSWTGQSPRDFRANLA